MPIQYVCYPVQTPSGSVHVAGRLRLPTAQPEAPLPAVVIVHGTAGPDSRGPFYSNVLNRAGMATLEIDVFTAHGIVGLNTTSRPTNAALLLPDMFGALSLLSQDPRIDPRRIGIMGFSFGGVVSMLTASADYTQRFAPPGLKFAAHLAFYPLIWIYNQFPGCEWRHLTGVPVLIQIGELDGYDGPLSAGQLVASLPPESARHVRYVVLSGATHGFDRREPPMVVFDPMGAGGKGGDIAFVPNARASTQARHNTLEFFARAFDLPLSDGELTQPTGDMATV